MIDSIEEVRKKAKTALDNSDKLLRLYQDKDYDRVVRTAESNLKTISALFLSQREMLLLLYEFMPDIPNNVEAIENNALHISIELLKQYRFPVYKITLPYLIPNKREKKTIFKNAITDAVSNAAKRYCEENRIKPFDRATVIFVSSYERESLNVDNDNKESSVIMNGLIGRFIRDDRASVCNTIYYAQKIESGSMTEIYITDNDYDVELYAAIKHKKSIIQIKNLMKT